MGENGLRIGLDVDDVMFPWYDRAHNLVAREYQGTGGFQKPSTWHPYKEYGISRGEWEGILRRGVVTGELHQGNPLGDTVAVVSRLRRYIAEGVLPKASKIVVVTARGETMGMPGWMRRAAQEQTHEWLRRWGIHADEVHFTAQKTDVDLDYMVDDNEGNVRLLSNAGVRAYLYSQPWNQDFSWPLRVVALRDYVSHIVGHHHSERIEG